jgi:hypothetical protein
MTIQFKLAEIKERADKATPAPWCEKRCNDDGLIMEVSDSTGWRKDYPFAYIAKLGGWGYCGNNGQFIAHARQDIPMLLSAIETAVEALEKIDNEWCGHPAMPKVVDDRQWCTQCCEWIYPNQVNAACAALTTIERTLSGEE